MTNQLPVEIWTEIALKIPTLKGWSNFSQSCKLFRDITSREKTKQKFQQSKTTQKSDRWGATYHELDNGLLHGPYNFQDEVLCTFYYGKKHGWYYEMYCERYAIRDREVGDYNYHHKFLTLKEYGMYNHGKKEGEWIYFYESGNKKEIINFCNDLTDGSYTSFYDDYENSIHQTGFYEYGKEVGEWITYIRGGHRNGLYQWKIVHA